MKLSLTERETEGKSKLIASSKYQELRIFGMCKDEGSGMSRSKEYLRTDIRNQTNKVGQRKRKKCVQRIGIIKKTTELRKSNMSHGTNKVFQMVVPGRAWRSAAPGVAQTREVFRGKWPVQQEGSLQFHSNSSWRLTFWMSSTNSHVREATSRTKVRRPAGAAFCEMNDLGVTLPSWQVLRMGDGRA